MKRHSPGGRVPRQPHANRTMDGTGSALARRHLFLIAAGLLFLSGTASRAATTTAAFAFDSRSARLSWRPPA